MLSDKPLSGVISKGDGRGRALGFPTANLALEQTSPPPEGIYAAWAVLNNDPKQLPAVVHCGPRPTFPGATASFEVHLLDFPWQDLYGQTMTISLVKQVAVIQKFESVEALRAGIAQNCADAREVLAIPPR